MSGTLYLVATPIGNLEDLSFRALRVLKEVDLVAAEDTRHSRKLFNHYGIGTALTSYYEHNEAVKGERLLEKLRQGQSVALISDAGMPAIADPGFFLVRRCRDEGIAVTAVPGPSAAVTALAISGLPVDRFVFEGFLPAKTKARREALSQLRHEPRTAAFYEAPHRLLATLRDLGQELGDKREIAVARELTKLHEELFRGTAEQALEHFGASRVRGEIVVMISPAEQEGPSESLREVLQRRLAEGDLPMRKIAKEVAKEFGLPGSDVYRICLELQTNGEDE